MCVEDEIYRSLLFGLRCINSDSSVVRFVSRLGIEYGLTNSVLGRNVLFGREIYDLKCVIFWLWVNFSFVGTLFRELVCISKNDDVDNWRINLLHECILLGRPPVILFGIG